MTPQLKNYLLLTFSILSIIAVAGFFLAVQQYRQTSDVGSVSKLPSPTPEGMAKVNIYTNPEGPINTWEDGARAGYRLQKGEISTEDVWLPNGSSSVTVKVEHGFYTGIIMACAEGHATDDCQDAYDYAKQHSLNMDVEPAENEGGYY